MADWLEARGVTQVAMEATGVYCKPVWAVLEDRFECILVNKIMEDTGIKLDCVASDCSAGPAARCSQR